MSSKPPTSVIRDGSLKATIWENQGEKGVFHTTTFAKVYEDRDGNLKDTNGFGRNDLLKVAELARQSYSRTMELYRENAPAQALEPVSTPSDDDKRARADEVAALLRESRERCNDHSRDR
ncbi:MAG: hypothetical protein AAGF28_10480 [Pseudomonadota bacterium]